MAVTVTWASSNANAENGVSISGPLDHGDGANGDTLTAQDIYIGHNGNYQISNCKFWMSTYSGTYSGDFSASTDLAELLAWGDASTENGFGGFQINMDAIGSFTTAWPIYSSKGTLTTASSVFRTGFGDSVSNGITLHTNMSSEMSIAGIIPANMTNWPHFRARIQIPTNEDTIGIRQFDQKLRFTYTT